VKYPARIAKATFEVILIKKGSNVKLFWQKEVKRPYVT
jgi:hypothetical protein